MTNEEMVELVGVRDIARELGDTQTVDAANVLIAQNAMAAVGYVEFPTFGWIGGN